MPSFVMLTISRRLLIAIDFYGEVMKEIEYEIIEHIGTIRSKENGYNLEANVISWNGRESKIDVRTWSDSRKPCKGITLTKEEAISLAEMILGKVNF